MIEVEGPGGLELDEEGRGRERGRGRSREKESGTGNRLEPDTFMTVIKCKL